MTLNITEPTVGASSGTWGQQLNDALTAIVAYVNSVEGNAQPVDSDLTAIAALATTAYGRSLLTQANAAAAQATLGLGTAATQATSAFDAAGAAAAAQAASQPLDSDLTAIAALTTTTFGRSFLALADAAAARTLLGLGTAATQASTAFDTAGAASTAQAASLQKSANLSDLANASTARTNLGLGDVATHAASEFVTTANAAPLAQSGQTPSQLPVAPSTAAAPGSLSVTARADHVHPSAGLFAWLGTGQDGAAVFDGTAVPTNATRVSSTLYKINTDAHYASVSISAGVTVDVAGFLFMCQGTLAGPTTGGTATITCAPAAPSGTNNGTAQTSKPNFANFTSRQITLGQGSPGKTGTTGAGTAGDSSFADLTVCINAGGAGGAGSGGAGGAGGAGSNNTGVFRTYRRFQVATTGVFQGVDGSNPTTTRPSVAFAGYGGGSGGGDGTNVGGAGGCGGNVVIVNALKVTGNVTVTAPGGAGGTPTVGNCGGGGGGAGGWATLNAADLTAWTGTVTAPGGAGGTAVGTGVNGAAGGVGVATAFTWL